jgi:hypothetical protein
MSIFGSRKSLWIVLGWPLPTSNVVVAEEFESASIILEHNATDGDYEVVIEATGTDAGIVEFSAKSPSGSPVATIKMEDRGGRRSSASLRSTTRFPRSERLPARLPFPTRLRVLGGT